MVYRVLGCPVCGEIQVSQADPNKKMKCRYCGKSRALRSRAMWMVKVYHTSVSGFDSYEVCSSLREKKGLREQERAI